MPSLTRQIKYKKFRKQFSFKKYPLTLGGLMVAAIVFAIVCWFCAGINLSGGEIIWNRIPRDFGLGLWFYLPPAFICDVLVAGK